MLSTDRRWTKQEIFQWRICNSFPSKFKFLSFILIGITGLLKYDHKILEIRTEMCIFRINIF